jgi:hypothetical protein
MPLVYLDRLLGARVAPDPSVATPHREGAEPAQLDALAASQSGGDLVEDRRNDEFSILLPQMRIAGDDFGDELCPGHRRRPRGSFSAQSTQRGSRAAVFAGAANQ